MNWQVRNIIGGVVKYLFVKGSLVTTLTKPLASKTGLKLNKQKMYILLKYPAVDAW